MRANRDPGGVAEAIEDVGSELSPLVSELGRRGEQLVDMVPELVLSLLVLGTFLYLSRYVADWSLGWFQRRGTSVILRRSIHRMIRILVLLVGVILVLPLLGLQGLAMALLASGSIGAIIVGFAFKDLGENFLAGIFLSMNRPFEQGDLIESMDRQGRVQSLNLRDTHIRTPDGRDIYLPNADLFKHPVTNYTRDGLRRFSFTVGIDYDEDAAQVRKDLAETLRQVEGVLEEPPPLVVIEGLGASTVDLVVHYWVDTFRHTVGMENVRSRAINRCKEWLLAEGVGMPADIVEVREFLSTKPIEFRSLSEEPK